MSIKPLRDWILDEPSALELLPPWDKCRASVEPLGNSWNKGSGVKVLGSNLNQNIIPEGHIVLGGICSIYTAESMALREELNFSSIRTFVGGLEEWIYGWYPRLDQIHDTVGIPPKNTRKIIYVCEDSFFARRLAQNPRIKDNHVLDRPDRERALCKIFQEVHEKQGHPVLVNWLRRHGYSGDVEVIYTSRLSKEINAMLRLWKRKYNHGSKFSDSFDMAVKMMYTPYWLDILGYDHGTIYEPAPYMKIDKGLYDYSALLGIFNKTWEEFDSGDLTFMGYLPFWSSKGWTRNLPLDEVPNFGNWRNFQVPEGEEVWYAVNMLFHQKQVINKGPNTLSSEEIRKRIKLDLSVYYRKGS